MITLETLRSALLAEQPWTEMDRLVRAEQAAGRSVKEIEADIVALVEPVRDAVALSEDADDAMMDTLDALRGNCAPRWRYTDTPDTRRPTEQRVSPPATPAPPEAPPWSLPK